MVRPLRVRGDLAQQPDPAAIVAKAGLIGDSLQGRRIGGVNLDRRDRALRKFLPQRRCDGFLGRSRQDGVFRQIPAPWNLDHDPEIGRRRAQNQDPYIHHPLLYLAAGRWPGEGRLCRGSGGNHERGVAQRAVYGESGMFRGAMELLRAVWAGQYKIHGTGFPKGGEIGAG